VVLHEMSLTWRARTEQVFWGGEAEETEKGHCPKHNIYKEKPLNLWTPVM